MIAASLVLAALLQASAVAPRINIEAKQSTVQYCPAPGLGKDPSEMNCHERNVYRANMNSDVPKTLEEMEDLVRKHVFEELPEVQSIYHNLKEDIPFDKMSQAERDEVYGAVKSEYAKLKLGMGGKARYLDESLPNRKFVSEDGREAVYNKVTGRIVETGPNQGTYNIDPPSLLKHPIRSLRHNNKTDVPDATRCGVNVNEEREREKVLSMDDLKKMDLDDKNGDWCHCENPQCIKRINRDATGKLLSHCVGFECAKCRKINVEHAKLALSIHQEALDQGLRPQWHGLNAEANAKAAGNAK